MRRFNILAIGPQEVCPPTDGGKESTYGSIKSLAVANNVTFLYPENADSASVSEWYKDIDVQAVPISFRPRESIGLIFNATLNIRPYKFEKYCTEEAVQYFVEGIGAREFDAIVCFCAHTANLGLKIRRRMKWNCPIIVREHNIEYELVRSYCESAHPVHALAALPFLYLTKREEQQIWANVDGVAFLTDRDLATAESTGSAGNLFHAPEGTALPGLRPAHFPGAEGPFLILFNPRAQQNVLNLKRFLLEYWIPSLPEERNILLRITGVDDAHLSSIVGLPSGVLSEAGISAVGFVQNLDNLFKTSVALIAPTFVGGGIRKKILESMAHQLPVIATPLDAASCAYFDPPRNMLVFDSVATFKDALCSVRTETVWQRLSIEGRATVSAYASWDGFARTIHEQLLMLTERGVQIE